MLQFLSHLFISSLLSLRLICKMCVLWNILAIYVVARQLFNTPSYLIKSFPANNTKCRTWENTTSWTNQATHLHESIYLQPEKSFLMKDPSHPCWDDIIYKSGVVGPVSARRSPLCSFSSLFVKERRLNFENPVSMHSAGCPEGRGGETNKGSKNTINSRSLRLLTPFTTATKRAVKTALASFLSPPQGCAR